MNIDTSLSHIFLNEQENLSYRSQIPATEAQNRQPPSVQATHAIEDVYRTNPRDIVEFQGIEIDLEDYAPSDTPQNTIDVRNMSPREMVNVSLDLYVDGSLSFSEYSLLAFQPELHPNFEDTIGALTGERPDPDMPRDFVQEWQDRQSFESRYPSDNGRTLKQINRVLDVLSKLSPPVDFSA
jgi:hypothetical protein